MQVVRLFVVTCVSFALSCCRKDVPNGSEVDPSRFEQIIADTTIVCLDVRTAKEYAEGHISRAVNIDIKKSGFMQQSRRMLPKDRMIAVYCKGGVRSHQACRKLMDAGYQVVELDGGIIEWEQANKPVVRN